MFPTESYVRSVLDPFEPLLSKMFEDAWKAVASLPNRSDLSFKRSVATLVHQFMMNDVRRQFSAHDDVRLIEAHETIRLLIGRTLHVRLKKMDRNGFSRAFPTQTALALTNTPDTPQLFDSSDMPDIFNVDMGYVLNELETRIDHILVAARFGEAVLWSYEANRGAATPTGTITPPPALPLSPGRVIKLPVNRKDRSEDGRA